MPGYWLQGRRREAAVQANCRRVSAGLMRAAQMGVVLVLSGCGGDPLSGPVDLFHDLQGGEIAAQRPPPPGAGQPYPKLGSVPAKPVLPAQAYRNGLAAQLLAERDRTQRVAADTPVEKMPPLPPPAPVMAAPVAGATGVPAATGDTAGAPPAAPGAAPPASATLDTAEAPPPVAARPAAKPAPVAVATDPAPPAGVPVQAGPAPGTPVTLAGGSADFAAAPSLPDAPPPPATFEGVSPEPLPTKRVLPAGTALPVGTQVFFADGSAVLGANQTQAIKDFLSHRRKQGIEVVGLGGAASDTPDGQAAAVELALKRARAVATALEAQRVPGSAIRLSADAFGRGAVLRLQ